MFSQVSVCPQEALVLSWGLGVPPVVSALPQRTGCAVGGTLLLAVQEDFLVVNTVVFNSYSKTTN